MPSAKTRVMAWTVSRWRANWRAAVAPRKVTTAPVILSSSNSGAAEYSTGNELPSLRQNTSSPMRVTFPVCAARSTGQSACG